MSLDRTKRYIIVLNLDDHEGYKEGEHVRIVERFRDEYYMVGNDNGGLWHCSAEELQEV